MEVEGKKGTVIFDFDGTLVDLTIDWAMIRHRVSELIGGHGITVAFGRGFTKRIFDSIDELNKADGDPLKEKVKAVYDLAEMSGIDKIRVKLGAPETVTRLSKDYDLAISSNNGSKIIRAGLQKAGLDKYFKVIMSRDTAKLKPNPDPIVKIINILKDSSVYMVGDDPVDIMAAKSARVLVNGVDIKTIGLTSSYGERDFEEVKPDFLIKNVSGLDTIL